MLLTYSSKDYRWWFDTDEETILSPVVNRMGVQELITRVRQKGGSVTIPRFDAASILSATGVLNGRIQELLQLAESRRRHLEESIEKRSDDVLFQKIHREYIPLLYLNLFTGRRYGQCFVAGTREQQEVYYPLPISPVKCGAWIVLALAISLLVSGVTNWLLLSALIILFVGLTGYSIGTSLRIHRQPLPERWIVFDDGENRAWQLAYLLAQAVSRVRAARISDPWFTALLEPPQADSVRGRNSFVYTMEQGTGEERKRTELLVAGKRAQEQFISDVHFLAADSTRLIFLVGPQTVAELPTRIRAVLDARPAEKTHPLQITIVYDAVSLSLEAYAGIANEERDVTVQLLPLPLTRMCAEARGGELSEETLTGYDRLLTFAGFQPDAHRIDDEAATEVLSPAMVNHLAQRRKQEHEESLKQVVGRTRRQP